MHRMRFSRLPRVYARVVFILRRSNVRVQGFVRCIYLHFGFRQNLGRLLGSFTMIRDGRCSEASTETFPGCHALVAQNRVQKLRGFYITIFQVNSQSEIATP